MEYSAETKSLNGDDNTFLIFPNYLCLRDADASSGQEPTILNRKRNQSNYKLYNDLLPMTKPIFQQFTTLTKSSDPVECLLLSTDPPTMKVIDKKILPVITAIETVELESFPQYYTKLPKTVVATYHQHETNTDMLSHDERIFQTVDGLMQPKLHIIGAAGKYRIYCARDGPVITAGQVGR